MSEPDSTPPPQPGPHYTGGQIALLGLGILLLLPGVCSLFFMIGMISEWNTRDPILQAIASVWVLCFFIAAVGIGLIYIARKPAQKPGA
jgi:ABC-type transport system involved in multi-copper enzyme maturation permease subunit